MDCNYLIQWYVDSGFIQDRQQFEKDIYAISHQKLVSKLKNSTTVIVRALSAQMLMNIYITCHDNDNNQEMISLIREKGLLQVLQTEESELLKATCKKEKDELEILKNQKVEYKDSKIYRCKKCKSAKVTLSQQQNRSADEAATVYLNCHNPDCQQTYQLRR